MHCEKNLKNHRDCFTSVVITDQFSRDMGVGQVSDSSSIIINYDLPTEKEDYLDRISRSDPSGRRATAINLIEIKKHYGTKDEEFSNSMANLI